eukprot:gene858-863_t
MDEEKFGLPTDSGWTIKVVTGAIRIYAKSGNYLAVVGTPVFGSPKLDFASVEIIGAKKYKYGQMPTYLSPIVNVKRAETTFGRECEPANWNGKTERVRGTKQEVKSLNAYLDNLQSQVYEAHKALTDKNADRNFKDHNKKVAALVGKAYAAGTLTRYETSLRHTLNSMEWKYGVSDLDIKAIDHDFISNYELYPLSENNVFSLFLVFFSTGAFAQYFPAPAPVGPEVESQLLLNLNHAKSDSEKVHLLLSLSNLYYNKPVKNSHDLDLGLKRAAQARDISTRLRDKPDFDYAQYYAANILMLKDDFIGAERILNTVSDSTKIKLIFAMVYRYLFRTTGSDAENLASARKYLRMETGLVAKPHNRIQEIQLRTYQALIDLDAGDLKKAENGLNEVLHQYQVIDNGIGMPKNIHKTELNSLGLELIKGLSEDIKATLNFETGNGTKITIKFEHDELNILIVEDQFVEAHSLKGLKVVEEEKPDLVLLDIHLRDNLTGIDLAKSLREKNIAFVFLSANSNKQILNAAKATKPYGFLVKPFREKDVLVISVLLANGPLINSLKLPGVNKTSVEQSCNWKIHGRGGAAELLELNGSTLLSRMKKLGIEKKISPKNGDFDN